MARSSSTLNVDELGLIEPFTGVNRADLAAVTSGATVERYDRKQTILPAGEKHDGIVVAQGGARLYRLGRRHIDVTVALLGPGHTYLLPVAAPAIQCMCVLEASQDGTIVYRLPGGPLRALITRDLALSDRMLTLAAQTVTLLADRLEEYVSEDVKTRLAHILAAIANGTDEPIMATHAELAALIGSTQTQVTKALAQLRDVGLVASSRHRRGLALCDRDALASYGDAVSNGY
jgi:CRP-like cAMP-binding protein